MSDRAIVRSKGQVRSAGRAQLPSVDKVLRSEAGLVMAARFGHGAAVRAIRRTLAQLRENILAEVAYPDAAAVAAAALRLAEDEDAPKARRVFNLTGTVLHTNLGRAILPEAAVQAAAEAMRHAIALEFDLATGARGERDSHVRDLICELTGAEDACIVNNNAAAVLLTLNTLSQGKDAIVSRGELIEIGGSFRLPDIMTRAGARLAEVGTTNRTHLKDYEEALSESAGLILKAHTSNYIVQGFTKSIPAQELAILARARGIPLVHDLGSGALVDLGRYGLKSEPTAGMALAEGADIVTFSGDKLLGGPQAGIIAGRKDLVARIARNPMKRALRLDKIRLAALEAVLKLYRDPDRLPETLPALRAFVRPQSDIASSASRILDAIAAAAGKAYCARVTECASQIGSGSLPLETLPSAGIAIALAERKGAGRRLELLASALRALPIPVIGRIRDGELVLDLRCLDGEEAFLGQIHRLRLDESVSATGEADL
ncbi:MAG: L-seryl-tRNA(Sec) selenium transferase [Rhodomicrobium sp.]